MEDVLLIWRSGRGNREALERIYQKYNVDMFTVALSLTRNTATAEDIVHDVFVDFAAAVRNNGHIRNLKAYLLKCVINRVRSVMRCRAVNTADVLPDNAAITTDDPLKTLIEDETQRLVAEAMIELPSEQMEVILLHLRTGLTFKEIAAIQDESINTVQARYRYGLQKLRSILKERCPNAAHR